MASVVKMREGKGKVWRALIRKKGHKPISKWFEKEAPAWTWANEVEANMAAGKAIATGTVGAAIDKYRRLRSAKRPVMDTSHEHYQLKMLERTLGADDAAALTPDRLIAWAMQRADEGAGPFTVNSDLSRLGTVLRHTGHPDRLVEARPRLSYLGLIGGAEKRERRPTEDESTRVLEWLRANKGTVYAEAARFAGFSAMRRGEITALLWSDIDAKRRIARILRKHPRKGKVLEDVPLLGQAWEIVQRQPKGQECVFPVHPQTLSKYFHEACVAEGIPDLHFHDLRHEGISAMFETGLDIPHVSVVSGHKDWRHLKRYTQIKPESVHAKFTALHAVPSAPSSGTHPDGQQRPDSPQTAFPRPRKS